MNSKNFLPLVVLLLGPISLAEITFAQKIQISSPKKGATVAPVDVVSGKISEQGHPFLLVRPKIESEPENLWWVQRNVQVDLNGSFFGQVHFGNSTTTDGTEFETIAILVQDDEFMKSLQNSYSVKGLPRGLFRSRPLTFKLDKKKKASSKTGFVSYPTDGDLVGRHEELNGIVPKYGKPVIFVRSVDGNGLWWVQNSIETDQKGGFKCDLYFGNEQTPDKSRFQIAVVVLEKEAAAALKKGRTLKELPLQHLGLQTLTVELSHEVTVKDAQRRILSQK